LPASQPTFSSTANQQNIPVKSIICSGNSIAVNLAAFYSACAWHAAAIRGASPPDESVPTRCAHWELRIVSTDMKDHMRTFAPKLVLTLALLSSASAAFAQGLPLPLPLPLPGQRSGTPEEQAACNRDVQRFCRSVISQGDLVILSCLQQNRAQITPACDHVLRSHGQ
jgi:Cysteine rich repeat